MEWFSPTIFPIPALWSAIFCSVLKLLLNITKFHQQFSKPILWSAIVLSTLTHYYSISTIFAGNLYIFYARHGLAAGEPSPKSADESVDVDEGLVDVGNDGPREWYYVDDEDQIQGPFWSEEMAAWSARGWLLGGTFQHLPGQNSTGVAYRPNK